MFPEAVLKTVLLINSDLLIRWRFVVHRAVEIAPALLLLGNALYAHLPMPLPAEAPWLSCDETRGRRICRARLYDGGTVNIKSSLSVNATSRDGYDV